VLAKSSMLNGLMLAAGRGAAAASVAGVVVEAATVVVAVNDGALSLVEEAVCAAISSLLTARLSGPKYPVTGSMPSCVWKAATACRVKEK